MENELIVIEKADIPSLFKQGGCDPILKRLREELDKFEPDTSTATGRKEIASFANKFAKAKTLVDGYGKDLVADKKKEIAVVDAERKKLRDQCDEMKQEARKPLTDWENAEKERVANIEARIQEITEFREILFIQNQTSQTVKDAIERLKAIVVNESFEEFELAATKAKAEALTVIEAHYMVLKKKEDDEAEAERAEKERLKKERDEREKRIAEEAAERARVEAEEKAKREAEEKERKEREEKERLERERLEAQLALERAEREKKEAEERAEAEKKEAAEKAEREKREAVEAEKRRQEEEKRREAEEAKKREENKRHRSKVIGEAKADLIYNSEIDENTLEKVITAILEGKIRHLKIEF